MNFSSSKHWEKLLRISFAKAITMFYPTETMFESRSKLQSIHCEIPIYTHTKNTKQNKPKQNLCDICHLNRDQKLSLLPDGDILLQEIILSNTLT